MTDRPARGSENIWDRLRRRKVVQWGIAYAAGFRNSPGLKRKLERNGVHAYWRAHGFLPQCRAVGEQDFTCD